jgi:hypothetical protein
MTADPHCSLHRAAAICMTAWLCAFASTPLLGQGLLPPGLTAPVNAPSTSPRDALTPGDALPLSLTQAERMMLERNRELQLAQEKSLILRDTAGLFARSMDAAEKRLAAGDIAGADLARMRVDALRAANEARMAEAERAQAALAYLIGAERSSRQLQASDRFPEPGVIAALDPGLIDARPDVRAAEARVKAAESARELARSLRTRDVSVGVQFEHFPSGPNDGASNSYGFGVSIPLFLRHSYEGELRRAEVDLGATRDNLERVRALARGEMERAWSELQSASERVTRYDSGLLQEARRAAEAAEFAYRNGALGIMDLLDARRTLRATQIAREAGGRIVAVKANLIGRDQGSFVAEAQKRVNKEVHLPAGYRVTWGGQFENQQRSMARLKIVVPLSLLLIFSLLFWAFRSVRRAGLVLFMVPFTLIGGIAGLALAGLHLSVSAAVGFIAVAGISVQNGVIMVEQIMEFVRNGRSLRESVMEGAVLRLRPILMTALMAGLGLLPAALSHGIGSETQRPFAVVIVGGIVSATIFTLLLLPLLYQLFSDERRMDRPHPARLT